MYTSKKFKYFFCLLLPLLFLPYSSHHSIINTTKTSIVPWDHSLYTPTMITKVKNDYFIIDCWHHRIIYNDNLKDNISNWNTLTDEVKGSHSLASNGSLYLCDDTDNNAIRVFTKNNDTFTQTQVLQNISGRPHYIKYDESTGYFYAISSLEGRILKLKDINGTIQIVGNYVIDTLSTSYVRSFNIIDDYMYFVSGPGYIYKVNYKDDSYTIENSYKVPDELYGMNFIEKIDDYFYITSYTDSNYNIMPMFIRTKDLATLKDTIYENLYEQFNFKGTPYYISFFNNKYYITEIDASSGIKSFNVSNNHITDIKTLYYFKGHSASSYDRKQSKY